MPSWLRQVQRPLTAASCSLTYPPPLPVLGMAQQHLCCHSRRAVCAWQRCGNCLAGAGSGFLAGTGSAGLRQCCCPPPAAARLAGRLFAHWLLPHPPQDEEAAEPAAAASNVLSACVCVCDALSALSAMPQQALASQPCCSALCSAHPSSPALAGLAHVQPDEQLPSRTPQRGQARCAAARLVCRPRAWQRRWHASPPCIGGLQAAGTDCWLSATRADETYPTRGGQLEAAGGLCGGSFLGQASAVARGDGHVS